MDFIIKFFATAVLVISALIMVATPVMWSEGRVPKRSDFYALLYVFLAGAVAAAFLL